MELLRVESYANIIGSYAYIEHVIPGIADFIYFLTPKSKGENDLHC